MNQPEAGSVRRVIRKRRTRRHRRHLLYRRFLLSFFVSVLAFGFSAVALRHLSPSLFRPSQSVEASRQAAEASRDLFLQKQEEALHSIEGRPIYPYSVVPGGVKDARELKWAADHDPVVATHYAGFDYDHARVVRLVLARTAYVSYRIGNKVYWTRRRVTLKKGETVITDGKITARTRCANRVEEAPEAVFSSSEPPAMKFDEPLPTLAPAEANPPVPYQSSLLNRPGVPGLGPAPPLSLYEPFGSGTWIPISPPPLPGVCGLGKKTKPTQPVSGKKKTGDPCGTGGGGGGTVPEPGTWLLMASGLAFMGWIARRRLANS